MRGVALLVHRCRRQVSPEFARRQVAARVPRAGRCRMRGIISREQKPAQRYAVSPLDGAVAHYRRRPIADCGSPITGCLQEIP
jgi:hypothetical protein